MEELEPRFLLLAGALVIGLVFGAVARATGFCLRSALIEVLERRPGRQAVAWAVAIPVALLGTQWLSWAGLVDLSKGIYLSATLLWLPLIVGGFLFGIGMVITRGCGGRHLVLAAGGNMRSWVVITVLGLTAYATLRGILALPRLALEEVGASTFASGNQSIAVQFSQVTGLNADSVGLTVALSFLAISFFIVLRLWKQGQGIVGSLSGLAIGLLVPAGWYVTGVLGFDEFDPTRPVSLTFTAPLGEGIQYLMTYTGADANFGITAVFGVLAGSFLIALITRGFKAEGFDTPGHLARYVLGAALMGFGGVLALGCTVGAGLTGLSTLSLGSLIAVLSIITGGTVGHRIKTRIVGGRNPKLAPA